jgi:lipopolysaccharide/colanic/teichoic acid biosynthesis glycosyltransferase
MNSPQQLVPRTRTASPQSRVSSNLPLAQDHCANGETESSPTRPALFLAWSNTRTSVSDATGGCTATPSSQPAAAGRRDRGAWLLHDVFTRREGWSNLNTELLNLPLPHPRSAGKEYAAAKRICDVLGALVLLILLAPLLLLVSLLVKIESPGPALFRQRRIGKNGKEFLLWKFRSMRTDAPQYASSPTSDRDWRLTRVGRVIRRLSIDELPQLINVLSGEMSLVGPRPEMPYLVYRYTEAERERLTIKPGITGLWQVSPARAYPIHENLQYDLHYIRHQNMLLDGAILLRTIIAVIRGVGAV